MANKITASTLFSNSVDITHHSKRTQRENVLKAQADYKEDSSETTSTGVSLPAFVTIEKAITYYHDSASTKQGSERILYEQTEKWLREYLTIKQSK